MAERQAWWDSPVAIAAAIVLATVPLLYPPIPPLVDLLGHMGRFRVELDGGHSPWLQQYYAFHWAPIGNLGVDLLVRLIAPVVGLEPAVKLIVIAIPALTAAGFLWVAREVHGRIPPTAYFAIPFAYGHPFLYGFVNFALAMALVFLALGLWLRLGRLGRTKLRAALFVPVSLIIFFAHAFAWGMLGLMCFSAELVRQRHRELSWFRSGINAFVQVSGMATPLAVMILWRGNAQGPWAWAWFEWGAKLLWIESALRDRWAWFDIASLVAAVFVIVQALRNRSVGLAASLAYGALAMSALFVILPETLFGSTYTDMRLVPYIFAALLLAVRFPRLPARHASAIALLAGAFLLLRLGSNTLSLAVAANDQQAKIGALAHVPVGSRVVSFVGLPCNGGWALQRNSHLGSLITIRRDGFSNDQWAIQGAFGLDIKNREAENFGSDPSQLVLPNGCSDGAHRSIDRALASFPRRDFDLAWLIDPPAYDRRLAAGLEPVWQGAGTALYRIRR